MHLPIKHSYNLRYIIICSYQASTLSSELVSFFRILIIISVSHRLESACHLTHTNCILFSRLVPYFDKRFDVLVVINCIITKFSLRLVHQININFLQQYSFLIERLECIQYFFFCINKIQHKRIRLSGTGTVQS